jgi:hypothetical protein
LHAPTAVAVGYESFVKIRIVRRPLAAAALASIVLAATFGAPTAALAVKVRDLPQETADFVPPPTPIFNLAMPPLSVASANAADSCANDVFMADRTVDMPWQDLVTVCGTVADAPPDLTIGGPKPAFAIDADGTYLVGVIGALKANAGDTVVVHGRYQRSNSGGEWIDHVTSAVGRKWPFPGYVIINGKMQQ